MGACVDWRSEASAILDTGVLPPPPAGPLEPGARHPLALDREGDLGAIDLRISAASGAYVAAVPAAAWTLTGYGVDGERLGAFTMDHRDSDG